MVLTVWYYYLCERLLAGSGEPVIPGCVCVCVCGCVCVGVCESVGVFGSLSLSLSLSLCVCVCVCVQIYLYCIAPAAKPGWKSNRFGHMNCSTVVCVVLCI